MTKKTELVGIIDRSGSMMSTKADAEGGFNNFIAEQRKLDLPCKVTLHQFDGEFETVWERQDLATSPATYRLEPRGGTALLDAIGKAVSAINVDTKKNVIVVIVTDGGENSSREWSLPAIKSLIEDRQGRGWSFIFVGAGIDAFGNAGAMGIHTNSILRTGHNAGGYRAAYAAVTNSVRTSRVGGQSATFAQDVQNKVEETATIVNSK